jgi:hypothetical protein
VIRLKNCIQDGGQFYAAQPGWLDGLPEHERPCPLIADYGDMVYSNNDIAGAERARILFSVNFPAFVVAA